MATPDSIVTVDGPAGSGKTTVAGRVAERLGYHFLDTGAMYRAATLAVMNAGVSFDPFDAGRAEEVVAALDLRLDDEGLVLLNGHWVGDAIRTRAVTNRVSVVSAEPAVRQRLSRLMVSFGERAEPGLVAEGRDMATVVFAESLHKFYLDARSEVRARRRIGDLERRGLDVPEMGVVLEEIEARDEYDSNREAAPLRIGAGVQVIDTSDLDIDGVVEAILAAIAARRVA